MSPFFTALKQWLERLANGAADLDPLTRARLHKLSGRTIAIQMDPPGEATTLCFDERAVRLEPGISEAPSVIVRGSPGALAAAFFGASKPGAGITIEGDELVLTELRSIARNFHPEGLPPLEELVGSQAAQTITGILELGLAAVSALARNVGEEGGRLVRAGVRQRYLSSSDFDALLTSIQTLRLRIDRLNARTELVERATRAP